MNQTVISTLLIAATACSWSFTQASENPAVAVTLPADMLKSRQWTSRFLSSPGRLPIAFKVNGKAVAGIPDDWKPVTRKRRIDANLIETIFEGTDRPQADSLSASNAWSTWITRSWNGRPGLPMWGNSQRRSSATYWPWKACLRAALRCFGTAMATSIAATGIRRERRPCAKVSLSDLRRREDGPAIVRFRTTASCSRDADCRWRSAGQASGRRRSRRLPAACASGPARRRRICG